MIVAVMFFITVEELTCILVSVTLKGIHRPEILRKWVL